uniref:Uncharacterized protein n=1 Tax=Schistosoma haematobium TaxID=6185 RepID=A0A094ZFY4_SCHHA
MNCIFDLLADSHNSKSDKYSHTNIETLRKSEFGLTDASSKEIKELSEMLAKVDRIYEAEGEDMTQFPMFKFEEPKVVIPASSLHVEYPKEPENNVEV